MAGAMGRVIRYVSQEKKTMDETGRRYLSGINCTPELAQKIYMERPMGSSSTSTSSPSHPRKKSHLKKRTKSLKNWRSGSSQAARCWWPRTWTRNTYTPT